MRQIPASSVIDWCLPPLIICYSLWGLYLSVFEIGFGWLSCHAQSPRYAALHILLSTSSIMTIMVLIIFLWRLPANHDIPPRTEDAIIQRWFEQYPHECLSLDGSLPKCVRGNCDGRVKPPRAHHCSVCQTCRMEWDHHCPWVGSCLTVRQSKAFLVLVTITSLSICFMVMPVTRPIMDGAYSMYVVSRADPNCIRRWWNWWGSYVVFGGPGGRWVLGTMLGYWVAELDNPPNPNRCRYGLVFMKANFGVAITVLAAVSFAGFCMVLALQMGFRLLRGQTTIEAIQNYGNKTNNRTRYLWVPTNRPPSADTPNLNVIAHVDSSLESLRHRLQHPLGTPTSLRGVGFPIGWDERVYDLGVRGNANAFWTIPLLGSVRESSVLPKPPIINPKLIQRVRNDSE